MAWALAALPLASAVLLAVLALLDVIDDMRALSALALLATAALVLADRRRLRRSGMASGGMPSAWWFLVPPVYLWRRAVALGRPKAPVWGWGASTVLAGVIRVVVLAVIATQSPRPSACRTARAATWSATSSPCSTACRRRSRPG